MRNVIAIHSPPPNLHGRTIFDYRKFWTNVDQFLFIFSFKFRFLSAFVPSLTEYERLTSDSSRTETETVVKQQLLKTQPIGTNCVPVRTAGITPCENMYYLWR